MMNISFQTSIMIVIIIIIIKMMITMIALTTMITMMKMIIMIPADDKILILNICSIKVLL